VCFCGLWCGSMLCCALWLRACVALYDPHWRTVSHSESLENCTLSTNRAPPRAARGASSVQKGFERSSLAKHFTAPALQGLRWARLRRIHRSTCRRRTWHTAPPSARLRGRGCGLGSAGCTLVYRRRDPQNRRLCRAAAAVGSDMGGCPWICGAVPSERRAAGGGACLCADSNVARRWIHRLDPVTLADAKAQPIVTDDALCHECSGACARSCSRAGGRGTRARRRASL